MTRVGITNYFVNTIVTALKAPEWETLLERFVNLKYYPCYFSRYFVAGQSWRRRYASSTDGNFHFRVLTKPMPLSSDRRAFDTHRSSKPWNNDPGTRASRVPNTGRNRKANGEKESGRTSWRWTTCETAPEFRICLRYEWNWCCCRHQVSIRYSTLNHFCSSSRRTAPADIYLARMRLFYSRPANVPHQNHMAVGLPPKRVYPCTVFVFVFVFVSLTGIPIDILNRLNPSYHRRPKLRPEDFVDPDARVQAEQARHLAKYVFARQFGLSNVFDLSARSKGPMKAPDFFDRESEIMVLSSFDPIHWSCHLLWPTFPGQRCM